MRLGGNYFTQALKHTLEEFPLHRKICMWKIEPNVLYKLQ